MRKYLGYIPAIFLLVFYLFIGLTGASLVLSMILIWLACFLLAAVLLHKGIIWGGVFGVLPALHMIYQGGGEILVGIAVLLFYLILSIYLWKKKDTDAPATSNKEVLVVFAKIALTAVVVAVSAYAAVIGGMILICMMVILLNGFLMAVDRRKRQLSLLRSIGATRRQARRYILCEALLLLGIGVPVGLILGVPLSLGAVRLFALLNQSELFYHFNGWVLLLAAALVIFLLTRDPGVTGNGVRFIAEGVQYAR